MKSACIKRHRPEDLALEPFMNGSPSDALQALDAGAEVEGKSGAVGHFPHQSWRP